MTERLTGERMEAVRQGLRMTRPLDEEHLERERAHLASLEGAGFWRRTGAYLRLIGPGYLQSAMTLGGGTAAAALFAGAAFGYQLLWVAPVGMLMGVVMLSAISWQTLSTGMRPFEAMRHHAGPFFAWAWALGALAASVIWHFPQYSLGAATLQDMGAVLGVPDLPLPAMSLVVLVVAVSLSLLYGSSPRLIRWYERLLKYMVWGIVLCFGLVVAKTGIGDWGALRDGFFTFSIPETREGIQAFTVIISGLCAAVGINMVFLYPYSLLARGWGREHRRLARFDLFSGMLIPYILATSLIIIATANTPELYENFSGDRLKPVQAAGSLATVVGPVWGRVIFNLGVLGMALSSITLQMLCCGFVGIELFGWEFGSWRYRLATLLPIPGALSPLIWQGIPIWLAVPTNIVCGLFLPLAYVGFILLQRSRAYLGKDRPRGGVGWAWLLAMVAVTALLGVGLAVKLPDLLAKLARHL